MATFRRGWGTCRSQGLVLRGFPMVLPCVSPSVSWPWDASSIATFPETPLGPCWGPSADPHLCSSSGWGRTVLGVMEASKGCHCTEASCCRQMCPFSLNEAFCAAEGLSGTSGC